jgi:hypothetical protein
MARAGRTTDGAAGPCREADRIMRPPAWREEAEADVEIMSTHHVRPAWRFLPSAQAALRICTNRRAFIRRSGPQRSDVLKLLLLSQN